MSTHATLKVKALAVESPQASTPIGRSPARLRGDRFTRLCSSEEDRFRAEQELSGRLQGSVRGSPRRCKTTVVAMEEKADAALPVPA
jgi:hypothetical protein